MSNKGAEMQLATLQAQICQAMADPKRVRLVYLLADGERSVGELADSLALSMANTSQHLAVLRGRGLVQARRAGTTVLYRIADPGVLDACHALRGVLARQLADREGLAESLASGAGAARGPK